MIYDFSCNDCGKDFTKTMSLDEYQEMWLNNTGDFHCVLCDGSDVKRRWSPPTIRIN